MDLVGGLYQNDSDGPLPHPRPLRLSRGKSPRNKGLPGHLFLARNFDPPGVAHYSGPVPMFSEKKKA